MSSDEANCAEGETVIFSEEKNEEFSGFIGVL